ncbi:MAG: hypothetical protein UY83_C0002G0088 [Candidatus Adlerbacteria bacterium GW2011_GWA1_54_10]|uniref:Uncharacterized protein n=2 Tax=Candidatus Adleribacteriota TaxID=1752736 RepID=A0A0G1XY51_9BACT|nr:MAG: hypothetical protein UY83_C0002G0088 [Candidatus Adlerbacteria bacterium GW2011_GWA1_54_10]KKW37928.1 MAG: hypothetical protein UY86_C0002G0025 [Candidatus Adlerbacteria bacterium GW2011_GWB1_54_7]
MTLKQFLKIAPGNLKRFWVELNHLPPHDYHTVLVCALGATLVIVVLLTLHGIATIEQ